jgi:hypothetical protein
MTKNRKLIACVGLALACALAYKFVFWKSDRGNAVDLQPEAPTLTQTTVTPLQASNQSVAVNSPTPVPVQIPATERIAQNDTKTGNESDAAEAGPSGSGKKLPPVGQFIPSLLGAVNPSAGGPSVEFLNKSKPTPNSQLLAPPNPQNVAGPIVSPETK